MKQYKFDYLKEMVDEWEDKSHVTRQQLNMLPWCIIFITLPQYDYYDEVIEDGEEWYKQRNEYLDKLWVELGSYKEIW